MENEYHYGKIKKFLFCSLFLFRGGNDF